MEQTIVRRHCPGIPARLIGCNGDNVALGRMADFIETQIRSLGNRHFPIVIIVDREGREISKEQMASDLVSILHSRKLHTQDIRIIVADRETEDWYLLDYKNICAHFNVDVPASRPSGKGGLARLISAKIDYHETTVGVELFDVISKAEIAARCEMFQKLVDILAEIKCKSSIEREII